MVRSVRIKDHHAEQRLFEQRALAAAVLIALAFFGVVSRLVWLQIVKYDYFVDLSQGNRIKIEPIPPNRGLILDRNGLPLATNAPSYQLEVRREQVPDLDATLAGLATIGLIDPDDIPAIKKDIRSRRVFDAVPIKLQMNEVELAKFAARRYDFPGVDIKPRLTRFYPLGVSSVHAIGYVGAISEDDKKTLNMDDYAGTTLTGKTGVEKQYEKELHGTAGLQQLLVNAQGRSVERIGRAAVDLVRKEPVAGNDLFLTIDERVQQIAEEALRGHRASAVAIDPANGDIIAFVSTPAFDPNLFARGLSRTEYLALTEDPNRPMYDRALRGVYPPGSTVKPMVAKKTTSMRRPLHASTMPMVCSLSRMTLPSARAGMPSVCMTNVLVIVASRCSGLAMADAMLYGSGIMKARKNTAGQLHRQAARPPSRRTRPATHGRMATGSREMKYL